MKFPLHPFGLLFIICVRLAVSSNEAVSVDRISEVNTKESVVIDRMSEVIITAEDPSPVAEEIELISADDLSAERSETLPPSEVDEVLEVEVDSNDEEVSSQIAAEDSVFSSEQDDFLRQTLSNAGLEIDSDKQVAPTIETMDESVLVDENQSQEVEADVVEHVEEVEEVVYVEETVEVEEVQEVEEAVISVEGEVRGLSDEMLALADLRLVHENTLQELAAVQNELREFSESAAAAMAESCPTLSGTPEDLSACITKLVNRESSAGLMIETHRLEIGLQQKKHDAEIFQLKSELGFCKTDESFKVPIASEEKTVSTQGNDAIGSSASTMVSFFISKYLEFLSAIPVFFVMNKFGIYCVDSYQVVLSHWVSIMRKCTHTVNNVILPYSNDKLGPLVKSLYCTYVIPVSTEALHQMNNAYVTLLPLAHQTFATGKLYYLENIQPQVNIFYVTYIEANWNVHVVPPYKTHLEPHVLTAVTTVQTLYIAHLDAPVQLYFEPIFDLVWNKLNRVAYSIHRFFDREDFFERLQEDITDIYFASFGMYTKIVTTIQVNLQAHKLVGTHGKEVATGIFCTVTLIVLILLRKVILGVLAALLFVILAPLLPMVYLYSKIRKLFPGKSKSSKGKGKKAAAELVRPAPAYPTFNRNNSTQGPSTQGAAPMQTQVQGPPQGQGQGQGQVPPQVPMSAPYNASAPPRPQYGYPQGNQNQYNNGHNNSHPIDDNA